MQVLDQAILDWIRQYCTVDFLDAVMPWISAICDHGEVWLLLAAGLLLQRKHRREGAAVLLALGLDLLVCNGVVKPLAARARPCDVNALTLLIPRPGDWSFPSGHTAASFAATGALKACGSRLWPPAFVLATLIAFSRLYLYVHWPSDVLAGAVLGAAVGFLADRLLRRWFPWPAEGGPERGTGRPG